MRGRRQVMRAMAGAVMAAVAGRASGADAAYREDFYPAIHDAAARYGTSGAWLIDVMLCESGGDPNAYNHRTGDSGLFQYQPGTFWEFVSRSGIAADNHWNPWQQIEVTAWAFASGYADHWVCSGVWDGSPS